MGTSVRTLAGVLALATLALAGCSADSATPGASPSPSSTSPAPGAVVSSFYGNIEGIADDHVLVNGGTFNDTGAETMAYGADGVGQPLSKLATDPATTTIQVDDSGTLLATGTTASEGLVAGEKVINVINLDGSTKWTLSRGDDYKSYFTNAAVAVFSDTYEGVQGIYDIETGAAAQWTLPPQARAYAFASENTAALGANALVSVGLLKPGADPDRSESYEDASPVYDGRNGALYANSPEEAEAKLLASASRVVGDGQQMTYLKDGAAAFSVPGQAEYAAVGHGRVVLGNASIGTVIVYDESGKEVTSLNTGESTDNESLRGCGPNAVLGEHSLLMSGCDSGQLIIVAI